MPQLNLAAVRARSVFETSRKWNSARRYPLEACIAGVAIVGLASHLMLRYVLRTPEFAWQAPLLITLVAGGAPLLYKLAHRLLEVQFGSDLLAGLSLIACVAQREYLVGAILVLMLSGGAALEQFATRRASSVLDALARRMPQMAHRRHNSGVIDVLLDQVNIGDFVIVYPHEICPADGVVVDGLGSMDEAYLSGEPFQIRKAPGSTTLSGAVNGDVALTIRVEKLPIDSRYSKIMHVVRTSEQNRPRLRRLGDQLGAWYTPGALVVALTAWLLAGDPRRFLAVLVIATPCPLIIAIPVAVIGAVSLAAKRSIIVRDPSSLERIGTCDTVIFDKTGTLTFGRPALTDILCGVGFDRQDVLRAAASLERYSKHPLGGAVIEFANRADLRLAEPSLISERPGEGLRGMVEGKEIRIAGRKSVPASWPVPPTASGLECIVSIDGQYAATFRFHDAPRPDGLSFIRHLRSRHRTRKTILLSGDRDSEVRYLARELGIGDALSEKSPEEKVATVKRETEQANTLFIGDGINDAPAMLHATVGIAFGQHSDVTAEAADAVILNPSLRKIDEFIHIGRRMRTIALQSAVGGMILSVAGMLAAASGYLAPLQGAIAQEIIDVAAVLNALRVGFSKKVVTDY